MSEQATIDAAELGRIVAWLEDGYPVEADGWPGNGLEEWAAARSIDLEALTRIAGRQAGTIFAHVASVVHDGRHRPLTPIEGLAAAVILGFQLGVDAERRRRDSAELPS